MHLLLCIILFYYQKITLQCFIKMSCVTTYQLALCPTCMELDHASLRPEGILLSLLHKKLTSTTILPFFQFVE